MTGRGPQPCKQPGCNGMIQWALTVRDPATGKGGVPAPVHWPFPPDLRQADGTVLPTVDGKVPNVALRKDHHGTWLARVATPADPIRVDERPAFMHHVYCASPPPPKTKRRPPASAKAPLGQGALDLGLPMPAAPGPLSDQALFPRRRARRG